MTLAVLLFVTAGCSQDSSFVAPPAGDASSSNTSSSGGSSGSGGVAGGGGVTSGGATGSGGAPVGSGGAAGGDAAATGPDAVGGVDGGAGGGAAPDVREESNFTCTLVLGAFQTSQWYDAGFERAVGTERWEIKSAHNNWTEKWADPNNAIWNLPTVSPCATNPTKPDRVLLIVYKDMFSPPIPPAVWEPEITKDVQNIKTKYPSVRRIELLTLARAPNNQPCPGNTSRNIVISPDIENAIQAVADKSGGLAAVGPKYYVPDCSMFLMNITTLTDNAGALVAPMLVDYYKAHP
ncbi:MAG TPA: hypothetical protein VNO55_20485 [Polyangia bacterium]|nr:hypothetical protein [Polyangia bacterium]